SFGFDSSLWFPEYNSSQTTGWFFNPNGLVRRRPAGGDWQWAERAPLTGWPGGEPVFARWERGASTVSGRIILVKRADKGSHGHKKQAKMDKHKPQHKNVKSNKMDQGKPAKKSHAFTKGRAR